MEFFHRHVSDGYRTYWRAPLDSAQQMPQELVDYASKAEGQGGVVGHGIQSEEINCVTHDSVWQSMILSIRDPARFFPCSGVSITECTGFVQCAITTGSGTYIVNIYEDGPACELVPRNLVYGSETDIERAVAVRTHPLKVQSARASPQILSVGAPTILSLLL